MQRLSLGTPGSDSALVLTALVSAARVAAAAPFHAPGRLHTMAAAHGDAASRMTTAVHRSSPNGLSTSGSISSRLAAEVLRKLSLATEAEEKDDRDVICAEVFADVTGELNNAARGKYLSGLQTRQARTVA